MHRHGGGRVQAGACPGGGRVQAVCILGPVVCPSTGESARDSAGEVGWFPSGRYVTNTQMSTAAHGRALRAHISAKVDIAQTMAGIPLGGLLSEPMQQPQGKEPSLPQLAHFT